MKILTTQMATRKVLAQRLLPGKIPEASSSAGFLAVNEEERGKLEQSHYPKQGAEAPVRKPEGKPHSEELGVCMGDLYPHGVCTPQRETIHTQAGPCRLPL